MRSAVSLSLFLALIVRVHSDVVLTQPKTGTAIPEGSITLTCKTSGFDLNSYYMVLVRQVPGQRLEWLLAYHSSGYKYFAPGIESRFTPSKDTSNNMISVTARNLRIEDTAVYYYARDHTVGYVQAYLDYWGGGTMVTVTSAAPSAPSPFILFTCEDHGSSGSFTYGCLALGYTPAGASFSWKKDDKQLTTGVKEYPAVFNNLGTYTRSSELTITEVEVGGGDIFCEVQHDQNEYQVKVPDRVVHHPTVAITITALEEIKHSRKAIAVCLVNDFTPARFTVNWLKNGEPLHSGIVTSPAFQVNGNRNFSATSQLTFQAAEWFRGSVYTCQVTHEKELKSQNISRSPDPHDCGEPKITILPPPVEQELMDMTVTLTCRVSDAPYGITVSWNREKVHLESEIQPWEHGYIVESKVNISTLAWLSGDYFECVVSHEDMPTPKTGRINWKKAQHLLAPSVSVLLPPTEEISAHKTITLTCFVRGFSPRRVFVTWTVDDKRVDGSKYRNTEVEAENGNDTFFTYSLLSVGAEQWASGASFSCLVGHEALPMKTIVRTVNKSSDYADNVPLEDYEEDRDNIWTTASTFNILFFLSISYGAAVTLAKVK